MSDIGFAVNEDGHVREAASEEVRKARGRVRTIEGRLRGVLKVTVLRWAPCCLL